MTGLVWKLRVVVPMLSDRANRWSSGAVGGLWAFTTFLLTLLLLWHVWRWPTPGRAAVTTSGAWAVRH